MDCSGRYRLLTENHRRARRNKAALLISSTLQHVPLYRDVGKAIRFFSNKMGRLAQYIPYDSAERIHFRRLVRASFSNAGDLYPEKLVHYLPNSENSTLSSQRHVSFGHCIHKEVEPDRNYSGAKPGICFMRPSIERATLVGHSPELLLYVGHHKSWPCDSLRATSEWTPEPFSDPAMTADEPRTRLSDPRWRSTVSIVGSRMGLQWGCTGAGAGCHPPPRNAIMVDFMFSSKVSTVDGTT